MSAVLLLRRQLLEKCLSRRSLGELWMFPKQYGQRFGSTLEITFRSSDLSFVETHFRATGRQGDCAINHSSGFEHSTVL
jgi:hypothetical protein